jgi:hypothetical protein
VVEEEKIISEQQGEKDLPVGKPEKQTKPKKKRYAKKNKKS